MTQNPAPAAADLAEAPTPYDLIGGRSVVIQVVERFYDLMEQDADYQALRDVHAADLTPMRASLAGFLTGWLGGPRDWFEANQGKCVMSLHARIGVTPQTARQWTLAMARALADAGVDTMLSGQINAAFARMSAGMAARSAVEVRD